MIRLDSWDLLPMAAGTNGLEALDDIGKPPEMDPARFIAPKGLSASIVTPLKERK